MTAVAFSPLLLHLLVVLHFVQLVSSTDHEPPHEEVGEHLKTLKFAHNALFAGETLPANVTNMVTYSRLQKQLEDIYHSSEPLFGTKNSFPTTEDIITDDIYLFGEHISGPNISDMCSGLLAKNMHVEECNKRVVRFKPGMPIRMPVRNLTLALPKLWMRNHTQQHNKPNITVFLCYEGTTILHLDHYNIVPEKDLVLKDQYYEHYFKFFAANDILLEVAIVVDHKWNNVNMKLHGGMGILFMQKERELRRQIYTKECNERLGREQECCRWPFRVSLPSQPGKDIVFHSCLGQVPKEVFRFLFLSEDLQKLLEKGLMSRRFVTSVAKTCRERTHSVRPVSSIASNGITTSAIHAIDAIECEISY